MSLVTFICVGGGFNLINAGWIQLDWFDDGFDDGLLVGPGILFLPHWTVVFT